MLELKGKRYAHSNNLIKLMFGALPTLVLAQFKIKEKACGGEAMPSPSFLPTLISVALLPDLVLNTPPNSSSYKANYTSGIERAFGEALCDGSALQDCRTCSGCLDFLRGHVLKHCNASTRVQVWAEECYIHFDIYPF